MTLSKLERQLKFEVLNDFFFLNLSDTESKKYISLKLHFHKTGT